MPWSERPLRLAALVGVRRGSLSVADLLGEEATAEGAKDVGKDGDEGRDEVPEVLELVLADVVVRRVRDDLRAVFTVAPREPSDDKLNRVEDEEGDVDHAEGLEESLVEEEGADNTAGADDKDDDGRQDIQRKSYSALLLSARGRFVDEIPEWSGGKLSQIKQKRNRRVRNFLLQ